MGCRRSRNPPLQRQLRITPTNYDDSALNVSIAWPLDAHAVASWLNVTGFKRTVTVIPRLRAGEALYSGESASSRSVHQPYPGKQSSSRIQNSRLSLSRLQNGGKRLLVIAMLAVEAILKHSDCVVGRCPRLSGLKWSVIV